VSKNVKITIYNTTYNFACDFVWVWNLVFDIKGGTYTEGVVEQGAEENIWTEEGWSDGSLVKTAQRELHNLYFSPSKIAMIK
jgi:hypothetical protein